MIFYECPQLGCWKLTALLVRGDIELTLPVTDIILNTDSVQRFIEFSPVRLYDITWSLKANKNTHKQRILKENMYEVVVSTLNTWLDIVD